ncbi:MAG: transglutaminase family protein [Pedosphaera sp.]|nr:transglutaminase family protein [Pedosphaera sp.]
MKWEIVHRTSYSYASPVRESFNEVRLKPVSNEHQTLDAFLLKILPAARLRHYEDFYANCIHHFEIAEPHATLLIQATSIVTTRTPSLLPAEATPAGLDRLAEAARSERCCDYLQASRFVDMSPQMWRLAVDTTVGQADIWQCALAIMYFVHANFRYEPNTTGVHTHVSDVLERRCGVCQDFAHVMLGMCRSLKIPALYVSGYLATEKASATHAWVEVFIPGQGWRGLDPTHNCQPGESYVKIAVGRDYADVSPVSGHYKGTTERRMEVSVEIKAAGS